MQLVILSSLTPRCHHNQMTLKVIEYREEASEKGHEWPYCTSLGDSLRASISCPDVTTLIECWGRLEDGLAIKTTGRLKVGVATNRQSFR